MMGTVVRNKSGIMPKRIIKSFVNQFKECMLYLTLFAIEGFKTKSDMFMPVL